MPPLREEHLPSVNRIFVDREEPQRIFEEAAFSIPEDGATIRVFYGVGGQGKTALCREIMRKAGTDPAYSFLRLALLDLRGKPKTDPDLLLVWIRNEFARAGLSLPCFDLALALMWEGARAEQPFPTLVKPWLGRTGNAVDEATGEVAGWLGSDTAGELLGEAIGEIPAIGFVLRRLGKWTIEKGKRNYLERNRDQLKRMYVDGELRPAYELSQLLPWMLAQDLNYHLTEKPSERVALLIDEYERVFDQASAGARWIENPFDRHIRKLVTYTNGLLAVFFSREKLPWGDDPGWRGDLLDHQYPMSGLADRDAHEFLTAIPITDVDVRNAIVDGARETSAPDASVYPLMLDLQVEHWRVLTAKGIASPERFAISADTFEGRCREMIERLLRDYDAGIQATIERLSVARRFDKAAFDCIVTTFGTGVPRDSFDRIAELSFVTRGEDGFLTMHNVVAAAIREMLPHNRKRESIEALFAHFEKRAAVHIHFELNQEKITALLESAFLRQRLSPTDYIEWLVQATAPLRARASYTVEEPLWREALVISEKANGPEHPSTGISLNNLAELLQAMGDYAAAKPLYEHALVIREKANGPEHPSTGASLNNLAGLLQDVGDYAAAKPLYERALVISEKANGPEHPFTGICLNNLAELLQAMGDYAAAKLLYERALVISEKANGPEHPLTGISFGNLAGLLQDMGDYAAAKPLYERALVISETANGPEHPRTGTSLNNLAWLLRDIGDYAAAMPLCERALVISEKANGPEHPSTGINLNNLARLLQDVGDYAAAKPLYERALAIFETKFGVRHPHSVTIRGNLDSLP